MPAVQRQYSSNNVQDAKINLLERKQIIPDAIVLRNDNLPINDVKADIIEQVANQPLTLIEGEAGFAFGLYASLPSKTLMPSVYVWCVCVCV